MNYKTITLELLMQRPQLHRQCKLERSMVQTVNRYALQLRADHEVLKTTLAQLRPRDDPYQIACEALEIAVNRMEQSLPPEPNLEQDELLSLDQAMVFLKQTTSKT